MRTAILLVWSAMTQTWPLWGRCLIFTGSSMTLNSQPTPSIFQRMMLCPRERLSSNFDSGTCGGKKPCEMKLETFQELFQKRLGRSPYFSVCNAGGEQTCNAQ